ncbi:MmgE/PrpD family protein [Paraburkholderia sp.]|uniref:MmgE/PrpD family protein n=1 Tax=Paraburkholderia sp. TaxID=1926495 RepID=UPI0039E70D9A
MTSTNLNTASGAVQAGNAVLYDGSNVSSYSERAAQWLSALDYRDIPDDVLEQTKLRMLDVIGVTLAGSALSYGPIAHDAALALGGKAESTILGFGERTGAASAAMANGLMAHALEYDDTHNETLIHASVTSVTTALALGESLQAPGPAVLTAIAGANELACRIGIVAPDVLLPNGFHPTAVVGTFSATYLACRLLGLDVATTRNAVGIAGSMTSGSMECWSDNTHAKTLHPGWSAHAGITAAYLARAGLTGPARIFEGRWGFFRSHVQQPDYAFRFDRLLDRIGDEWESRNLSFKPYPVGHVIHPFLDAILHLYRQEGLRAEQVREIRCLVHPDWLTVVCEPVAEKLSPKTAWHGRISLQYTLAEALHTGHLDVRSYADESLFNPAILTLAKKIVCEADPNPTDRKQFKGWVVVDAVDGRRLERVEPFNRGSRENPMTASEIVEKFRVNLPEKFHGTKADAIVAAVTELNRAPAIAGLIALCQ